MRSPLIRITWLARLVPDLGSNSRPARTATPWGGGACMSMRPASQGGASGRLFWPRIAKAHSPRAIPQIAFVIGVPRTVYRLEKLTRRARNLAISAQQRLLVTCED